MKELNTIEINSVSGGVLTDKDAKKLIIDSSIVGGTTVGALFGGVMFGQGIPTLTAITAVAEYCDRKL